MAIILKVANKFPKSCDECPLFVDGILGHQAFCISKGKYTKEEIASYEDGALDMYYHGCLSERPKNCPLVESEDKK